MDIDNFKSKNGLNLACLVSGVVFSTLAFFVFKEISDTKMFNFTGIFLDFSLMAIAFIIGFFIQGIRYLGFNYYLALWQKAQPKRRAGKKYPSIKQRIIFYAFRNGTVVEECLDSVMVKYDNPNENEILKTNKLHKKILDKKYRPTYDWIQKSGKNAAKDMWIYATKINKVAPQDDVYRFYNWSEVFQCLDTTFLLFSTIIIVLIIINVLYRLLIFGFCSHTVSLIIMLAVCILLHLLSKSCAKMYARRFLYQIEKSLKSYKKLIDKIY
jgi:hypothetical protein